MVIKSYCSVVSPAAAGLQGGVLMRLYTEKGWASDEINAAEMLRK